MGPETTTELNTWKPGALGLSCSSVRSEPHGALTAAVQHLLSPPCPSAPSVPGTWPQHFAGLGHQVILAKACGTRPLPAGASPHCQHTRATLTPGRADPTGARWDTQTGVIAEARLKDLTPAMPVIFIKAIPARPQKKFLISGVTILTQSFTCRLGCSKVADDTVPERK